VVPVVTNPIACTHADASLATVVQCACVAVVAGAFPWSEHAADPELARIKGAFLAVVAGGGSAVLAFALDADRPDGTGFTIVAGIALVDDHRIAFTGLGVTSVFHAGIVGILATDHGLGVNDTNPGQRFLVADEHSVAQVVVIQRGAVLIPLALAIVLAGNAVTFVGTDVAHGAGVAVIAGVARTKEAHFANARGSRAHDPPARVQVGVQGLAVGVGLALRGRFDIAVMVAGRIPDIDSAVVKNARILGHPWIEQILPGVRTALVRGRERFDEYWKVAFLARLGVVRYVLCAASGAAAGNTEESQPRKQRTLKTHGPTSMQSSDGCGIADSRQFRNLRLVDQVPKSTA
jgi:hypothetical protein